MGELLSVLSKADRQRGHTSPPAFATLGCAQAWQATIPSRPAWPRAHSQNKLIADPPHQRLGVVSGAWHRAWHQCLAQCLAQVSSTPKIAGQTQ